MALILLAGGNSTRMGKQNKALLPLKNDTMIGIIIKRFKPLFRDIFIVAKEKEPYKNYPAKVVLDEYPGCGPMGGVHVGLKASSEFYNLVLACDMPLVKVELVDLLMSRIPKDLIIPKIGDYLEPLAAIYAKSTLPLIEKFIQTGDYKLINLIPHLEVEYVLENQVRLIDPDLESFINVNSPGEYNIVKRLLTERN